MMRIIIRGNLISTTRTRSPLRVERNVNVDPLFAEGDRAMWSTWFGCYRSWMGRYRSDNMQIGCVINTSRAAATWTLCWHWFFTVSKVTRKYWPGFYGKSSNIMKNSKKFNCSFRRWERFLSSKFMKFICSQQWN